jgi:hypothetical protein
MAEHRRLARGVKGHSHRKVDKVLANTMMIPCPEGSPPAFQVGDLVLRRVQMKKHKHKLAPPWEGPYMVVEVIRHGAYRLHEINDAMEV